MINYNILRLYWIWHLNISHSEYGHLVLQGKILSLFWLNYIPRYFPFWIILWLYVYFTLQALWYTVMLYLAVQRGQGFPGCTTICCFWGTYKLGWPVFVIYSAVSHEGATTCELYFSPMFSVASPTIQIELKIKIVLCLVSVLSLQTSPIAYIPGISHHMLVRAARTLLGKGHLRELAHPFSKRKEFAKVVHCFCLVDLASIFF